MRNRSILKILAVFFLSVFLTSCGKDKTKSVFGIFKVIDDKTVEMNGEIGSSTLDEFNDLIITYPNIKKINIKSVPGSSDDEINLEVSAKVYKRKTAIHLMDGGDIESGGVDFFLAGTSRTKGENTKIGVHSWSDGTKDASDFARDHANHKPYIDYYKTVGFTQAEAEAFYYFTIYAAPSNSIHYMTDEEIKKYKILKP